MYVQDLWHARCEVELLIKYEVRLSALSHNETHTLSVIYHIKHY